MRKDHSLGGYRRNSLFGFRKLSWRFEQLEPRWALDGASITIALANDTGASSTDLYTSDPTVAGTVTNGSVYIQFDHKGDGTINGSVQPFSVFQYNPLATDSSLANWEGPLAMAYRFAPISPYGDVGTFGPWTSMNIILDRVAPVATTIPTTYVAPNTTNTTIALGDYFHDGATSDANLAFSIASNSNPSLFDSVSIDTSHHLVLNYASNQTGAAQVNVQCVDLAGNASNSVVTVLVGAPLITNFGGSHGPADIYTFSGTVLSASPVAGLTVTFGGILANYNLTATVAADGTFSVTDQLIGLHSGSATAVTKDVHGISSNIASNYVTVNFVLGDMNGDGVLDNYDIAAFELALADPAAYLAQYPWMTNYQRVGDINGDGVFNNFDIPAFEQLLA